MKMSNAGLAILSFSLILGLAETFFQFNSVYKWIERKEVAFSSLEPDSLEPIPADVANAVRSRFPKPLFDSKTYSQIAFGKSEIVRETSKDWVSPRKLIGMREPLPAEKTITERARVGEHQIIQAHYTLSPDLIRKSTDRPMRSTNKNILLLGCSFAFGQGVSDEETITAFLAKDFADYNVYNLGVPGGGLTSVLNDIYYKNRIAAVPKTGGAAIYIFFKDHFRRHFTSLALSRRQTSWKEQLDYRIENGRLIGTEKYSGLNALKLYVMHWLAKSEFLYFTGWGYNPLSRGEQDEFLENLEFIRTFYKSEYNLEFYFYTLSAAEMPSRYFYEQLKARKFNVMTFENLESVFSHDYWVIPADNHLAPAGNELLGRLMAHRLRKDGF
jgi:hypothetical protein